MRTNRKSRLLFSIILAAALLLGPLMLQTVHALPLTWSYTTHPMNTARSYETATLLNNGKVLIAGGSSGSGYLSSAELYNPDTDTWAYTDPMNISRANHTATLLANGKVLVVGGSNGSSPLNSAELYDPDTGHWTLTPSMTSARYFHSATRLLNGQVLVTGGIGAGTPATLTSAELYDPLSNTWRVTGSLNTRRNLHTATLLPNGKVLVAGGSNTSTIFGAQKTAELYTPSLGTWQTLPNDMAVSRMLHTATMLSDGSVLIAGGGNNTGYLESSELFDYETSTWTTTDGAMNNKRYYHSALLLTFVDGTESVMVAGGSSGTGGILATTELFDPGSKTWIPVNSLNTARFGYAEIQLLNGYVLAAGGTLSGSLATAELYDPTIPTEAPDVPTTVSPNGSTITEVSYVWEQTPGATSYNIIVERVRDSVIMLNKLVNNTFCNAGICTYHPANPLAADDYRFKVRASNGWSSSLYSPWRTFTVKGNLTISGNVGVAGVKLSYFDVSPREVTSGVGGSYAIPVSWNWSGTITPSLIGYIFAPTSKTYASIQADKSGENYTATPIQLTLTPAGNGIGTVTSSPGGINCGSDCTEIYPLNTAVTLSVVPDISSLFGGWSGSGCSGTGTCLLTMSGPKTVTATFNLKSFTLTAHKTGLGSGSITSDIPGIDCGVDCSNDYLYGTIVTLTANPLTGSAFTGWSGGGCSGRDPCQVTVDAVKDVTANFAVGYGLEVELTGTGVVTSNPTGINCGVDCFEVYSVNTWVTLTATPTGSSAFVGWSGGGCSGNGTCTVKMDSTRTVTAQFESSTKIIFLPVVVK